VGFPGRLRQSPGAAPDYSIAHVENATFKIAKEAIPHDELTPPPTSSKAWVLG
jgi:hypothetical protein